MLQEQFPFMKVIPILSIKSTHYILGFVLLAAVFTSSCDRNVFFSDTKHIRNDEWKATDTLFFTFHSADTLSTYDFYFQVRNTTDYDKQNLYFFITAFYPENTYSRDTAECILAAPDGKWYGKGMGKYRDSRFLFRKEVRFRKAGDYIIAVNQAMREEKLKGISEVGISIKKQTN